MVRLGPLVKAKETAAVFVRRFPALRTLLGNRRQRFERLHTILPSNAVVGEPVTGSVQVWDQCERLIADASGEYALESTDTEADHPATVTVSPSDEGYRNFGDITFRTPGVQYLLVTGPEGQRFVSNPVRVTETAPEERVYWGDLHLHSSLSDGTGSMADGFRYGRDVMDLDVVAYTDHDTMGFFIPPSLQRRRMHDRFFEAMQQTTADFHDPGRFVTLFAYEWTKQPNQGGHLNVYFDSVADAELFDSHAAATDTYEGLWERLREYNADGPGTALSIPHHTAEAMYPFDFAATEYDDELAPLVEVYSQWGSSERPASDGNRYPLEMGQGEIDEWGHYVQDAHELGHRVGMLAGADFHGPLPGHSLIHASPHLPSLQEWREEGLGWGPIWRIWNERSYPGGLTAFRAPALTRDAIFDALRSRSVYGTTQPDRILVDFRIDDVAVGEDESTVTLAGADAERTITLDVAGTAPLERVTVTRNGTDWWTIEGTDDPDADLDTYTETASRIDDEPITGATDGRSSRHGATTGEGPPSDGTDDHRSDAAVYALRVWQANGGAAWAGPIWVEPPAE
jgi:hypothetical protein